jgi:hypothetical protein
MMLKPSQHGSFLVLLVSVLVFNLNTSHAIEKNTEKSMRSGEYTGFLPTGKITRFTGESLYYDISFLWFKNAASAKVSFYEEKGTYFSTLEASTKGFVGFFTSYRKHFYKAEFEIIDNGKKLRPKSFLRKVTIGSHVESTRHTFNYDNHFHTWEKHDSGKKVTTGQDKIPTRNTYSDILTSFYNVRNSIYGKLEKGMKFKIKTIPEKGHDEILVHIWSEMDQEKFRKEEERKKKNEFLVNIHVPKEIFKTETGELMVWTSKHYVPVETIVKDYILLGDLHARFTHREVHHYQHDAGLNKQ